MRHIKIQKVLPQNRKSHRNLDSVSEGAYMLDIADKEFKVCAINMPTN